MKMAITWTIIVLGTLLHGMQCNANDAHVPGSTRPTSVDSTTAVPNKPTDPLTSLGATKTTVPSTQLNTTKAATLPTSLGFTIPAATTSSPDSNTLAAQTPNKATSPAQTAPSSTSAHQNPTTNPPTPNVPITTQITTIPPTTANASTAPTASNSPQNTPTPVTSSDPKQVTTNLNKPTTTITTEGGTTQLSSTLSSAVAKNLTVPNTTAPASKSTDSQSVGTTKALTTTLIIPGPRIDDDTTTDTSTPQEIFNHSFDLSNSTEVSDIREACKTLGQKVKGNCTVNVEYHDKRFILTVTIYADQKIKPENYKPQEPVSEVPDNSTLQKEDANKNMIPHTIPDTLIAILASCGALVLILCCFAAYCTYHRRSYRKNQQHLTEELQTVENGYHDNPTLEVMEIQPEMQEKKLTLNGEFNDSWIVPIDNLLKEDIPDEEDTHL